MECLSRTTLRLGHVCSEREQTREQKQGVEGEAERRVAYRVRKSVCEHGWPGANRTVSESLSVHHLERRALMVMMSTSENCHKD